MTARVVVTGSSGFIGRRLCDALRADGLDVRTPGRDELLGGLDALPRADKVYHLAARTFIPESWIAPGDFYRVNVQGTVNVLEYCRRASAPLVYVSSYCYGVPDRLPIPETAPLRPNNPYAFSKVAAEAACAFFSQTFHFPVTILRPFNVYGPGQSIKFLIPELVQQALDPAKSEIVVLDAEPRRDFFHVDDMVAALRIVPVNGEMRIYNVGSGRSIAVDELAELIQRVAGTDKPIVSRGRPRPEEIPDVIADISAMRAIGWQPRIDLAAGLKQLVAAWRQTSDTIV